MDRRNFTKRLFFFRSLLALGAVFPGTSALALTSGQVKKIGQRIWKNECDGKVEGLTSWNSGEDFASLGIGHFIWYPVGKRGPFEESFPPLVAWLSSRGVVLPGWLKKTKDCPWSTRAEFLKDSKGDRQKELRQLLSATLVEQAEFIIHRLNAAVPKLIAAGGRKVKENHDALAQTPEGMFAMIDYINFKGDGINPNERYNGEGWGLAQVLDQMRGADTKAFAESAKRVLARRVKNSPPARGEGRWLEGWSNRCDRYKLPL